MAVSSLPTPAQAIGAAVFTWVLWKALKLATRKDPFANIPGPPSGSRLKGNFLELVHPQAWGYHKEIAEKYGGVLKITGFFGINHLYVHDPKALHSVIIKDTHIFDEAEIFIKSNSLVFGKGLLSTVGDQHRKQRKMLTPVFSTKHMRDMIPIFYEVVSKTAGALEEKVKNGPQTVDLLSWLTRTALELIGQSGLGYSFDPLTEQGTQHPYTVSVKQLNSTMERLRFTMFVLFPLVGEIGTPRFRRWVVDALSTFWKNLRAMRDLVDVMDRTSIQIFEEKKAALKQGSEAMEALTGQGKDIISILLKANMLATDEDKLSDSDLLGQMSTLTFSAMDTTSNALCRILHTLCTHQDAQDKVRQEIMEAQEKHGQLQYDELNNLPYLDAICRETMRVYPPVPMLIREAHQDGMLPVSKPIIGVDGKEMNEIFVPKGTKIFVSILASNRNPDLWGPDVYEWKPERWMAPPPEEVVNAKIPGVYSHLMTFYGGTRSCIGVKFSQLEMKVVLSVLIPKFKFELGSDKEVNWLLNGIAQPAIMGEDGKLKPQLPLKLTLLRA